MLKRVVTTLLVLGASSFLNAGDDIRQIGDTSEVFIGVELGATFVQGDTLLELNHEGDGASVGLRLGAQNAQWRSMAVLDYFNSDDDDQTYTRGTVQVDYYIMASDFSTAEFRPYVGVNGGYMNYESSAVGIDENGVTYGGQIGFTSAISTNVDLDMAYRYSITNPSEMDHIGNLVFGVNFLY